MGGLYSCITLKYRYVTTVFDIQLYSGDRNVVLRQGLNGFSSTGMYCSDWTLRNHVIHIRTVGVPRVRPLSLGLLNPVDGLLVPRRIRRFSTTNTGCSWSTIRTGRHLHGQGGGCTEHYRRSTDLPSFLLRPPVFGLFRTRPGGVAVRVSGVVEQGG